MSILTPISLFLYPLTVALVAEVLEGNRPNAEALSYYYTTLGLLFGFAVNIAYTFLQLQVVELNNTIYEEAASLNNLLEECACSLEPQDAVVAAEEVRRYLTEGAWVYKPQLNAAEALASEIMSSEEAVSRLARYIRTCKGERGAELSEAVRLVRVAGTKRLSAGQSKLPDLQLLVVKLLAALVLLIFPLTHATSAGDALEVGCEAVLFANLCWVVTVTVLIIDDLSVPYSGLFSVVSMRETLQDALLRKCEAMEDSCTSASGCITRWSAGDDEAKVPTASV